MLPLTIWMNIPSLYQEDLFRALVATGEVDLDVIYAHRLPADRRELGWTVDLSGYDHRFLDERDSSFRNSVLQAMRLAWQQRHRIHIVNGIWAEPPFSAALSVFALIGSTYAIYSEAPNPHRERAKWKRFAQKAAAVYFIRHAAGLLPVAHFGINYYRSLGVTDNKIYPFGYFRNVEHLSSRPTCDRTDKATVEFIFVGQLVIRKGVDLLLEAFARTKQQVEKDVRLTLVGVGGEQAALAYQAAQLGIVDSVTFLGSVSADEVPHIISRADALVLPSRWDGWGMVVNEALLSGVPAVVSDACGAAMLIHHGKNGFVFRSENVEHLTDCLLSVIHAKQIRKPIHVEVVNSRVRISVDCAVQYLVECLHHMRDICSSKPAVPWEI